MEDMDSYGRILCVSPIICLIGLIANVLVMAVGLKGRLRKLSFTVHLLTLSLSDLGYLLTSSFTTLSILFNLKWFKYVCPVVHWLDLGFRLVSSWTIVWITIERSLGVCYPLKAKRLCTRIKAMIISFSTVLVSFLTMSFVFYLGMEDLRSFFECTNFHYNSNSNVKIRGRDFMLLRALISLLLYAFFPALAIIATNVAICLIIRRRNEVPFWRYVQRNIRNGETYRIIGMLLINVIAFIVLTLPYDLLMLYQIYYENSINDWETLELLATLTYLMMNIHHSLNPIIYSLAGSMYREELYNIFCVNHCYSGVDNKAKFGASVAAISNIHLMEKSEVRRSSIHSVLGEFPPITSLPSGPNGNCKKAGDSLDLHHNYSDYAKII